MSLLRRAYVGFDSTWKTPLADIDWTQVPLLAKRRLRTRRGREDVKKEHDAGEIDAVIPNPDRDFDPLHVTGPFYGRLLDGVPFKITVTPDGEAERTIASGFLTGWPQGWDESNQMATVEAKAYGILSRFALARTLGGSVLDLDVLADAPELYAKLDDTTESQLVDSSGNSHDGAYDNPELGEDALVLDGGSSAYFAHVGDHRGRVIAPLVETFPLTIEAWIKVARDLTHFKLIVSLYRDNSSASSILLSIPNNGSPYNNANGCVGFSASLGGTVRQVLGSKRVDDGQVHHVVIVCTTATSWKLYVDGVEDTLTVITAGTPASSWSGIYRWCIGNTENIGAGDFGLEGFVDSVAVYGSALSAGRVLAHYQAGTAPWDGDSTGGRIFRLMADVAGLPLDRLALETGHTTLGPAEWDELDLLEEMRLVTLTEAGDLRETADDRVWFLDRYWPYTATVATVVQATFSDDPVAIAAGTAIPYTGPGMKPDDELLCNVFTAQRRGGNPQTVVDQASIDQSRYADDKATDLLFRTDAESRSRAEHEVTVGVVPQVRVESVRVPLHKLSPSLQADVLALNIGYRVAWERHPQRVGDPIELERVILGIEHEAQEGEHWVTFFLSPAPSADVQWFRWGITEWGEGRWGF